MQSSADCPIIETVRLEISPLLLSDASELFHYRSLPEVTKYQTWTPRSVDEAKNFILSATPESFNQAGTWYQLGLRLRADGALVGDVGLHFLEGDNYQVEVGITVSPEKQNLGIAKEALIAVLTYLFCVLEKHRVIASIDPENRASRKLLERLGLRQEARSKEFVTTWSLG